MKETATRPACFADGIGTPPPRPQTCSKSVFLTYSSQYYIFTNWFIWGSSWSRVAISLVRAPVLRRRGAESAPAKRVLYVCVYIYIYIHTYVYVYMYVHIYIYIYTCIYIYIYITYIYIYICIHKPNGYLVCFLPAVLGRA